MLHSILQSVSSYVRFWWKSTNHHGVHSPFVFQLVTKCLYQRSPLPSDTVWKVYQQYLFQNHQLIKVHDFGAGSKIFTSNHRKTSAIAKHAGISKAYAKRLIRLVSYFKPNHILEIGTSLGLGTLALHLGNPKGFITTIEGCSETLQQTKNSFQENGFSTENIQFVQGEFSEALQKHLFQKWDLVYFDGNHSKKATLQYVEQLLPSIHNNTVWIFDDIHWSNDMEEAWTNIQKHPKVSVTIDLYQWGLVFFRSEQAKEHFVIRV